MDAKSELTTLLEAAKVDVDLFHHELQIRGHAIHLSTLARYIGETASKSPPPWMIETARQLAEKGTSASSPVRRGSVRGAPETPKARTLSCLAPAAVVEAVEALRASDPSKPSEKQVVLQLIERGLASLAPKEDRTRKRYACAVCGHISDGRLLEAGSEQTDPSMRFPKKHKGPDGQPCAGNYRYARTV